MKNLVCVLLLCCAGGCKLPDNGVIDTTIQPFISQATISPSSINVNRLANQPTDPIDTTIVFSALVENINSTTLVTYTVMDPFGNAIVSGNFTNNGSGKFSASMLFHILKQDVGLYSIKFQAINDGGNESNILVQSLFVENSNDHAPFISNLIMPDTVNVPPAGDTTFVKITIAVSDSDGIQDIAGVSLTSHRPDNSVVGVYPMYDDGSSSYVIPFGLKSGDAIAGDGIYTLTIPLLSSTTGNTYRIFSFVAIDRSGVSSNILTKNIFIQ